MATPAHRRNRRVITSHADNDESHWQRKTSQGTPADLALRCALSHSRERDNVADHPKDLSRTTLAVLFIILLIGLSLWVLRPFLAMAVWAVMVVVATWPLLQSLEQRLNGRRGLAVAGMSLALLLLLVIPLILAIATIANHATEITDVAKKIVAAGIPDQPDWVAGIPLIGEKISSFWAQMSDSGPQGLVAKAQPYAAEAGRWALAQAGSVGFAIVQFLLVVAFSAVLYADGEAWAAAALKFGQRLAGLRGRNAIILAGQAIRGVALGVGITAIVQTAFGGIGLAIAGIPFAALLSAVMLMFCIAQLGPSLILFPAVGWLFWTGDSGWGTFLLVWSLFVATMDNFLRPFLIKKGADLPLLLILIGVIGGLLGFGLIGIFVGPVVLAVSYTLLDAWINDDLEGVITDSAK
ncbi:MAG: AI-2E family transporter YdiK [Rhodocyclaceae bacterium]|nr:AI-2E family transporter YdiK [Rhodocyclaceae bacterium]